MRARAVVRLLHRLGPELADVGVVFTGRDDGPELPAVLALTDEELVAWAGRALVREALSNDEAVGTQGQRGGGIQPGMRLIIFDHSGMIRQID